MTFLPWNFVSLGWFEFLESFFCIVGGFLYEMELAFWLETDKKSQTIQGRMQENVLFSHCLEMSVENFIFNDFIGNFMEFSIDFFLYDL